jgi:MarR family transcriptional regulator, organic hydroperoxide resistance regulator
MATASTTRRGSPAGDAPPSGPSAAGEAWGLMHELMMSMRGRFLAIASELDLSPPQLGALKALEPGRPLAMSELAGILHCDNSNVTGIIDRLEDRGLVERRSAEHDRRVKMLVVTPAGAELRQRLVERMSQPPPPLAALSADDQRALRDIMRRALDR